MAAPKGVYQIKSLINGKSYIGSSINIHKRWRLHKSELTNNKHHSIVLQRHVNKYGIKDLQFIILEETDESLIIEREQYYIDREEKQNLYNINPLASGTPNMSKETILKRAETLRKKYASGEIQSNFKKGHVPWNKGKTKQEIDYSFLKNVKKTI